jgi:hypothetical protein
MEFISFSPVPPHVSLFTLSLPPFDLLRTGTGIAIRFIRIV